MYCIVAIVTFVGLVFVTSYRRQTLELVIVVPVKGLVWTLGFFRQTVGCFAIPLQRQKPVSP